MKPRRTKLTPAEQVLLRKLQRGVWTVDELSWIERHRLQLLRANA
jgi:hypothetical protein